MFHTYLTGNKESSSAGAVTSLENLSNRKVDGSIPLLSTRYRGMPERIKGADWKSDGLKGYAGSNPVPSAI
jgi:hypothetical protein